MPAKVIALTVVAVAAIACARTDNPQTKRDSTPMVPPQPVAAPIAKSNAPCTLAGGRLRVSNDSVGQFDIHTATIGQVLTSCPAADTAYQSIGACCYMAVTVTVHYPGAIVQVEQVDDASVPRPGSLIRRWEITGDSVYLSDSLRLPPTLAGLETLGPGVVFYQADSPDDPEAIFCSQPSLGFRIRFGAVKARMFAVGDSVRDQKITVTGLEAYPRDEKFAAYCTADVLKLAGKKP